jgi:CrcB protein
LGRYLAVALGGALGAMARYWIGTIVGERFPTRFPLGTLIINVTGSFIIGFFLTLVSERINIHPNWRLAVAVGFVGAYTTFSTFEYETFKLLETGSGISGFMNVIISLMFGFLGVWGGIALAREVHAPDIARRTMSSPLVQKAMGMLNGVVRAQGQTEPESVARPTPDQPAGALEEPSPHP